MSFSPTPKARPPWPQAAGGSVKMVTYKVKRGETIGDVAGRYNISVRDIATLNRLGASAKLRAGQVIKIPIRSTPLSRTRVLNWQSAMAAVLNRDAKRRSFLLLSFVTLRVFVLAIATSPA